MKYDHLYMEVLHYLAKAGWSDDDTGEDAAPNGSVWLIEYINNEAAERGVRQFIDEHESSDRKDLDKDDFDVRIMAMQMEGSWIIREDAFGTVWFKKYDSDLEAVADFQVYEGDYDFWLKGLDEIEVHA